MNYHENEQFFYGMIKLIVKLSLIVSIDTNIKEQILDGLPSHPFLHRRRGY